MPQAVFQESQLFSGPVHFPHRLAGIHDVMAGNEDFPNSSNSQPQPWEPASAAVPSSCPLHQEAPNDNHQPLEPHAHATAHNTCLVSTDTN